MSSKLLRRLMEDSALELLLIMAQHVSHVSPLLACASGQILFVCTLADQLWPFPLQSHLLLQGRLRGEAPLILEIVAALFKGLQPESLVGQESVRTLRSGHRHSSQQAQPATKPAAPRPLARRAGPRHPRFGGVFTKTLDDGVKQCSLAGAKQDDLLGPVKTVAKAGVSKVCAYLIFPEVVSKGDAHASAHPSGQGLNDHAGTRWGAGASARS